MFDPEKLENLDIDHNYLMKQFNNSNEVKGHCDKILLSPEIARNIVGNHADIKYSSDKIKLKGLLFKDFCLFDNLLVVLHGKVISIIDINKKEDNV